MIAALLLSAAIAPVRVEPTHCTLAFGSCADERRHPELAIFDVMARSKPDVVVLLGDTPYIDSTDLEVQRARYRTFFAVPSVKRLVDSTTVYATWDDHDFGTNDCDGRIAGKANSRRAFLEFHANPCYGEHDQGIYTSFRRGPAEVFVLDTRWFSATEDSAYAAGRPTLLGKQQWAWLERSLLASTAPFKIVACGMIWNAATRPAKPDDWGVYPYEREHLFQFLGAHSIGGVVLIGGDIHRSRVVRHATREAVGYEITELITSPLAQSPIAGSDVLHPGLVWDRPEPESCLVLDVQADGERGVLAAHFLDAKANDMFTTRIAAEHLRPEAKPAAPASGFLLESKRDGALERRWALYVPPSWRPDAKLPALLCLHGMGECGTDGEKQLSVGLAPAILRNPERWPFVVVFPQKPTAEEEWEDHEDAWLAILDEAVERYGVDRSRIAITGLSQGGHGTWQIARRHPERFCAVVPICGYPAAPARGWKDFDPQRDWSDPRHVDAAREIAGALSKKPIWAFHGAIDPVVPARLTSIVFDALRAQGSNAQLTTFADVEHDAWVRAYRTAELATWMLEQRRP